MVEVKSQKSRTLVNLSGTGTERVFQGAQLVATNKLPYSIIGKQTTVSGNHPEWYMLKRAIANEKRRLRRRVTDDDLMGLRMLQNLDVGGSFYTQAQTYVNRIPSSRVFGNGTGTYFADYEGPQFPRYNQVTANSTVWQLSAQSINDQLAVLYAKGATAIARCAPTAPNYSLSTALGEIRNDGIPMILGSSFLKVRNMKQLAHATASEYLNLEFGWKPFIADIRKLCQSVIDSEKILSDYEKRAGNFHYRKYDFPDQVTTVVTNLGARSPSPALNSYIYSNPNGVLYSTVKTVEKTWFSGSFRYNLPTSNNTRGEIGLAAAKAEHLLGLRLTPEVLWNLAPWSWLSDWFVNVGSLMTNFTAFGTDALSLRHGYIMSNKKVDITYDLLGVTFKGGNSGPLSQSFLTETKMRRRASPWGFGVTFSGFTPRQIAILAALGITRGDVPE